MAHYSYSTSAESHYSERRTWECLYSILRPLIPVLKAETALRLSDTARHRVTSHFCHLLDRLSATSVFMIRADKYRRDVLQISFSHKGVSVFYLKVGHVSRYFLEFSSGQFWMQDVPMSVSVLCDFFSSLEDLGMVRRGYVFAFEVKR